MRPVQYNRNGEILMNKSIKEVEQETEISVEVLRQWERRYGFPTPIRNSAGDRRYSTAQITKLKMIKILIDAGLRPGKLFKLSQAQLEKMSLTTCNESPDNEKLISLLKSKDVLKLEAFIKTTIVSLGLSTFLTETLPQWNYYIGESWDNGIIQIYEEHLYTELIIKNVRAIFNQIPTDNQQLPQIMLTTVPGENHSLGVLMVEGMLRLKNIPILNLGIEMPIVEIAKASKKYNLRIVGLSFSVQYDLEKAITEIKNLRKLLSSNVTIWIGGKLFDNSRLKIAGVVIPKNLKQLPLKELL